MKKKEMSIVVINKNNGATLVREGIATFHNAYVDDKKHILIDSLIAFQNSPIYEVIISD